MRGDFRAFHARNRISLKRKRFRTLVLTYGLRYRGVPRVWPHHIGLITRGRSRVCLQALRAPPHVRGATPASTMSRGSRSRSRSSRGKGTEKVQAG